jgi:ATP-binding cassette subfamily C (CFTR/MRP) protein 1
MQILILVCLSGLSQYSQSLVSCQRMMTFFCLDEMDPYVNRTPADDDVVIKMEGVDLGWVTAASLKSESSESKSSVKKSEEIAVIVDAASSDIESAVIAVEEPINRSVYTLKGLNFSIKKGELVAVVGSVGSGKSSLLSGLLGEMILNAGKVHLVGSVAYCDQRAWILNESVQNNVLFGRPYDEGKFDAALYAADLEDDIKVLPGGVQTQIGEKGINLSGGQKARVALARALYSDADVFLLDDPLSAVDAHVGQFLFHECIRTCMAGKTRVLVTHNVHLLQYCDKVIVLQDGGIKAMGTFEEIEKAGVDVTAIEAPAPAVDSTVESSATTRVSSREMSSDWRAQIALKKSVSSQSASNRKLDSRSSTITTVEEKNEGDVKLELYSYYIRAGGILLFLGLVIFMMATQLFQVLSLYWLSYWGQESNQAEQNGDSLSANQNLSYLNIFAVLSVLSLVCYLLRSIFLANHRLGTSTKLHLGLLQGILNSPISFFDGTPIGRILNRFSSDMVVIDEELSQTLSQVTNTFSNVLGALGAIIGATKGTFLILFVPLVFMYNEIQKYFRNTNTAVAR